MIEVALYFLNRMFFQKPTDHQVIWTSFLYFASKVDSRVILKDDGEFYEASFYIDGVPYKTHLRGGRSTDIFVFFQVFIAKGYYPLINLLKRKAISPKIVIDSGANVGYFSLLMTKYIDLDLLVTIEPEPSNYNLLIMNLTNEIPQNKIHFLKAALWSKRTMLSIDNKVGGEWATQVSEASSGRTCIAFSLRDILIDYSIEQIDVLKIDIEGAEAILFDDRNFIECLSRVKVIAMEIHDDLADRNHIKSVLRDKGFYLEDIGELSLAWRDS